MLKKFIFISITILFIFIQCKKKDSKTDQQIDNSKIENIKKETEVKNEENLFIVTATGGLKMRQNPDLNADLIVLIPESEYVEFIEETGETFTIQDAEGKWTKVKWNDKTGWVFGGFLIAKKYIDDIEMHSVFIKEINEKTLSCKNKKIGEYFNIDIKLMNEKIRISCFHEYGEAGYDADFTVEREGSGSDAVLKLYNVKSGYQDRGDFSEGEEPDASMTIEREYDTYYITCDLKLCGPINRSEFRIQ